MDTVPSIAISCTGKRIEVLVDLDVLDVARVLQETLLQGVIQCLLEAIVLSKTSGVGLPSPGDQVGRGDEILWPTSWPDDRDQEVDNRQDKPRDGKVLTRLG